MQSKIDLMVQVHGSWRPSSQNFVSSAKRNQPDWYCLKKQTIKTYLHGCVIAVIAAKPLGVHSVHFSSGSAERKNFGISVQKKLLTACSVGVITIAK